MTRTVPAIAAAALAVAGAYAAATAQPRNWSRDWPEMTSREEIHRSFRLPAGALVSVSGTAGPVFIETHAGDAAEVHVVRMAASQRELDCYRTDVAQAGRTLRIEHVQESRRRGCSGIHARQEVRLSLPRTASLDLSTIAGSVTIAPIEGNVALSSIAGPVTAAGVRSGRMDSLAGGLTLRLAPLARDGVSISSVVGPVSVDVPPGVNASLSVDSVMGRVISRSPSVQLSRVNGDYRATLGAGGPPLRLSSIVGRVTLDRE